MKAFLSTILAGCACLFLASVSGAEEVEWAPEANMDHQLFPSLLIATASVRPVEPDDAEAEKPDPYLLGERFGLVGVSVKVPVANAKVLQAVRARQAREAGWLEHIERDDYSVLVDADDALATRGCEIPDPS